MIIDKFLQLDDNRLLSHSEQYSDVIDFGQKNPNTGMDDRTRLVITINESVTFSSGSGMIQFILEDSSDIDFFDLRELLSYSLYENGDLVAGSQIVIPMPTRLRRYFRLGSMVNNDIQTGRISAQIVTGFQQNDHYPDSPNIA